MPVHRDMSGVVGHNDGTIRNCYSRAGIDTGDAWGGNGGICANNEGTIDIGKILNIKILGLIRRS